MAMANAFRFEASSRVEADGGEDAGASCPPIESAPREIDSRPAVDAVVEWFDNGSDSSSWPAARSSRSATS